MIRFVKRSEISRRKSLFIRVFAVFLALLFSSVFILSMDLSPFEVYRAMLKGAFGSEYKIKQTIISAIPLVITALGISIAFKMQFWNIGGEGQIIMGAFAAAFVAIKLPVVPESLTLPLMIVAGIVGGALWSFIPALLKLKLGTNETIVTLMMNYIAYNFVTYLQYGPWKDPKAGGFPIMPTFPEAAILPKVIGIHAGWIIALVLVIFIYIFVNHTKKGYEIAVLGESEKTAIYAGVDVKRTVIVAMLTSGGLCGLAGMLQASAVNNTLSNGVAGGAGFTAIIIAWLAQLNSFAILIVSILFAALVEGGSNMQTVLKVPGAAAAILQSMILFFVLGSEFFVRHELATGKSLLKLFVKKEGESV